jgi:hypothetical protein
MMGETPQVMPRNRKRTFNFHKQLNDACTNSGANTSAQRTLQTSGVFRSGTNTKTLQEQKIVVGSR